MIGGEKAVNVDIYDQVSRIGTVRRIAGADRYETSVKLAKEKAFFVQPEHAVIVYAYNFPDGLCGGPLAYSLNAPMILTGSNMKNHPTEEAQKKATEKAATYLKDLDLKGGLALGGENVLPDFVVKHVFDVYNIR